MWILSKLVKDGLTEMDTFEKNAEASEGMTLWLSEFQTDNF